MFALPGKQLRGKEYQANYFMIPAVLHPTVK